MATKPAIKCTPVDLTDEQRANLAKLAAYLRTLPSDYPDFEMASFTADGKKGSGHSRAYKAVCGTAACAAGHGPIAGIKPKRGETWEDYSYRAFVDANEDHDAWSWCFASIWSKTDNTVHGAAARIEFMLANGVPKDGFDQRIGDEPLCYSTEASA